MELLEPTKDKLREIIGFPLVDADIANNASISQSKINLSITNAEIATGAAIDQSKINLQITNTEVSNSAAIAQSKLALAITNTEIASGADINALKIGTGAVTNTEFEYLDGVTSAIQTQINLTEKKANKGIPNGYAALDSIGELVRSYFPSGSTGQILALKAGDSLEWITNTSGVEFPIDYPEETDRGTVTTAQTINFANATRSSIEMIFGANVSLNFTNGPPNKLALASITIKQDSTGGRVLSFPSALTVINGQAVIDAFSLLGAGQGLSFVIEWERGIFTAYIKNAGTTLADFITAAKLIPLNQFAPAIEAVNMSGQLLLVKDIEASGTIDAQSIGTDKISLDEISTPNNPPIDIGILYTKDLGGTTTLYFKNSTGLETNLLVHPAQTPWGQDIQAVGYDIKDLSNILFRSTTGAPLATDYAIYRNALTLVHNVPTNGEFDFNINGVTNYSFSALELNFSGRNITNANIVEYGTAEGGVINNSNYIQMGEITKPANPAANFGRLYVKDVSGLSSLFFLDSAGAETNLIAHTQQTPWLSDISANGKSLTSLQYLGFNGTDIPTTGLIRIPKAAGYILTSIKPGTTTEFVDILSYNLSNHLLIGSTNNIADLIFGSFDVMSFGNNRLQLIGAPLADTDAATRKYVDDNSTLSPLTTKGDLYGYSTAHTRIPVGTNGQVLTANSVEALGVKWETPATVITTLAGLTDTTITVAASKQMLIYDGTWKNQTITGDVTITTDGVVTIGVLKVTNAMLFGSIATSKITGFDTQVRTNRLDQMAIPTANLNINTKYLTDVGQIGFNAADTFNIGIIGGVELGLAVPDTNSINLIFGSTSKFKFIKSLFTIQSASIDIKGITEPSAPATDVGRLYALSTGGVAALWWQDKDGTKTNLVAHSTGQSPWEVNIVGNQHSLTDVSFINIANGGAGAGGLLSLQYNGSSTIVTNDLGSINFNYRAGGSAVTPTAYASISSSIFIQTGKKTRSIVNFVAEWDTGPIDVIKINSLNADQAAPEIGLYTDVIIYNNKKIQFSAGTVPTVNDPYFSPVTQNLDLVLNTGKFFGISYASGNAYEFKGDGFNLFTNPINNAGAITIKKTNTTAILNLHGEHASPAAQTAGQINFIDKNIGTPQTDILYSQIEGGNLDPIKGVETGQFRINVKNANSTTLFTILSAVGGDTDTDGILQIFSLLKLPATGDIYFGADFVIGATANELIFTTPIDKQYAVAIGAGIDYSFDKTKLDIFGHGLSRVGPLDFKILVNATANGIIDFSTEAMEDRIFVFATTPSITFSATSIIQGRTKILRLYASGGEVTFTFPNDWNWLSSKPSSLASNSYGILSLTAFDTTSSQIVAVYSTVQ